MSAFNLFFPYFLLFFLTNGNVIRNSHKLSAKNKKEVERNAGTKGWNDVFVDEQSCPKSENYICNLHNPQYNCTCYRSNQISKTQYPQSCDDIFHIQNVQAYVIELKTKLPRNLGFMDKFDNFLADIIEDYCAIDPKYLIILRKRCSDGNMLVQIAFLRVTDKPSPDQIGIKELQAVHPSIFTQNKEFMEQTYLPILKISEVDFLTPVIRQESIVNGENLKQEKSRNVLSSLFDISYIVFFGVILFIANFIPICLLWKIIHDRKTRDSSPLPTQPNHL